LIFLCVLRGLCGLCERKGESNWPAADGGLRLEAVKLKAESSGENQKDELNDLNHLNELNELNDPNRC